MENILSKFNFYLDNPFKNSIKIALIFGSAILIVYFTSIHFMPIGNFKSLLYVILSLATIGFIYLVILILSFFIAPIIWMGLLKDSYFYEIIVHDKTPKIFDISNDINNISLFIGTKPKYQSRIILYYAIPVLFFQLSTIILGYFNYNTIESIILNFLILSAMYCLSCLSIHDDKNSDKNRIFTFIESNKFLIKIFRVMKFIVFSGGR